MENNNEFSTLDYLECIGILRRIGFNTEEIKAGIQALPEHGTANLKELIIQIGVNALNGSKEHGKKEN